MAWERYSNVYIVFLSRKKFSSRYSVPPMVVIFTIQNRRSIFDFKNMFLLFLLIIMISMQPYKRRWYKKNFQGRISFTSSVIKQKDQSQNGDNKKTKHAKFSKKANISYPLIRTRTSAYQEVRNNFFFGKFGVLWRAIMKVELFCMYCTA